MRHLIAKRNRLRDMVAEQEKDRWLTYSDHLMHDLISDENFALMLLEIEQHRQLRSLDLERRTDEVRDTAKANAMQFAQSLVHTQDGTRHALRQMQIWEARLTEAEANFAYQSARVRDHFQQVQHAWEKLSDQERAFFDKPVLDPSTAMDFPTDVIAERGLFYPERTALQEGQLRKLREELERVEAALGSEA